MSTRDAMVRLAEQWETMAENLADVVSVSRHPNVLDVLRRCAADVRRTLPAQSAGTVPASDVDALREAARRLRAGANVGENPRSAIAAGLRGVADTFDAWADETRLRDQPMRCSIAAMARVILEDAE